MHGRENVKKIIGVGVGLYFGSRLNITDIHRYYLDSLLPRPCTKFFFICALRSQRLCDLPDRIGREEGKGIGKMQGKEAKKEKGNWGHRGGLGSQNLIPGSVPAGTDPGIRFWDCTDE